MSDLYFRPNPAAACFAAGPVYGKTVPADAGVLLRTDSSGPAGSISGPLQSYARKSDDDSLRVLLQDVTATGDLFHGDSRYILELTLEQASLTGTVSADASGPQPCSLHMVLKNGAVWHARGSSSMKTLTIEPGASLHGRIIANGVELATAPGSYLNVTVLQRSR